MSAEVPKKNLLGNVAAFFSSHRIGNLALLLLALLGVYLFAYRGGRFFLVPSISMEHTLLEGDQIVTLRPAVYRRGDIVVLHDPENPKEDFLVKRITGLGGDSIGVRGGALFLNGTYASEPYIVEPMVYEIADPIAIPEGEVFIMGDNRNYSEDSSSTLQTVPEALLVGKVIFIYFPFERMGPVYSYPLTNAKGE
ncbi:MAG: signal peptidase I [Candidatus Hydrogenedentes bacterium]|nr:signal peptidase I [Candidatus Hydrogenedentota bacterium]